MQTGMEQSLGFLHDAAEVDYARLPELAGISLLLSFFSVLSMSSVPERVLRRAAHVGYLCWVESSRGLAISRAGRCHDAAGR